MPPRRFAPTLLALAVLAGCDQGNKYAPPPPPEVTVRVPTRKPVKTYLEYSGVTQSIETVELRARVKGFLKERKFEEGRDVKAGELLLVIDETEYRANVEKAEATLAEAEAALQKATTSKGREIAQAQLALDQAAELLSQIEQTRQRLLVGRNAGTQQDLDRADANLKKSVAQVEADQASLAQSRTDYDVNIVTAKAQVASAKAALDRANIDLGYCRITSPIAGKTSRAFVDVGNLVGDGSATLLATVLKDDEMYAYMSVSESDILRFRSMRAEGSRPDYRVEAVPLELALLNETGFPHKGKIQYADPGVDPTTGTVQARGIFPNKDGKLIPGAFVRVRVPFETRADALLVPEEALGSDAVGRYVLVVGPKDVVERRSVTIGSQVDDDRIVESGLKPDDRVVVNGLQRARPGQAVKPVEAKPATATTPEAKPAIPPATEG